MPEPKVSLSMREWVIVVISILGALASTLGFALDRFVTIREYESTLKSIDARLDYIQSKVDNLRK